VKRALLPLALILAVSMAIPARADFSSLARAVSRKPGVHRVWIPFMGLARAAVWVVSPKGVHDFQLVTFEGRGFKDAAAFGALMQEHVRDYQPMVRVRERGGAFSYIYVKPGKNDRIDLIVFSHDNSGETVLVRVEVDAKVVAAEIGDVRHVGNIAGR
jgi:hypothetical protein